MSFLLATLNPGKTRRRRHRRKSRRNPFFTSGAMKTAFMPNARKTRHRRRRKLTAWQSAVKRFGGVMQAVRAMRGRKRKHTHRKKRRSTVSRRRLRSRSRRVHRRRPKMARVRRRRHRRTPPRGAGGRFKSRHHRRHRRHRRNPVVPTSWSGNPHRRRRRHRRRNPLYLSRKGFSARKHRGYRRLHRRRHSPRYWHNPVLPYFAFNPKRRRHHGRRHHRRSGHRRYRRNPVLPFFAFNPMGGAGSIVGRMKSMIDVKFWTETALPVATGFFASKLVGNMVYQYIPNPILTAFPPAQPYIRLAVNAASGAAMAWGAEKFVSKKAADGIWIGTIVGVASGLLKQLLDAFAPGVSSQLGLSGLGDDISSQMKDAVVRRVQANLGTYMTRNSLNAGIVRPSLSSYATRKTLSQSTYDPSPRMMMSDYDVANTDTTL